jgi:phytoene synthase
MPMRWPDSPAAAAAARADLAACRELLRGGSRSFQAASLLLPRKVALPAAALYAFCRLADDAIDLCEGSRPAALEQLHARLDRAYAGTPLPIAADRAFASIVELFGIPRALPAALLEGFAWDIAGRRYETMEDLEAYGARVAGTVGAMMSLLMGVRDPRALARAAELGVAMQLTNIVRDIGEDARAGRLYLPQAWLHTAGLDPDRWLASPAWHPAIGEAASLLLQRADTLYLRATAGIALLPAGCQPGIRAARLIYAEIGRSVEREGVETVLGRAVVPGWRKAMLLARSLRPLPAQPLHLNAPPLQAIRFLVDAVEEAPAPAVARPAPAGVAGRFVWLIDMLSRLERQERLRRFGSPVN